MRNNYDVIAGSYDFLSRLVFGQNLIRSQICLLQHIPAGSHILIAGGGTGWILEEIARIHPAGLSITYIEISERMIDLAKKCNAGQNQVSFVHSAIDRANLNMPLRPGFEYKGFIHWDYDPETKPQNVQGVLALADQDDENMGGFQCIPELFRTYDTWKLTQPEDRNHFKPDTTGFEPTKVKMNAGDLLIFNSLQPHGIRANRSTDKVRIAQYIAMMPAQEDNEELRQWRINSWKERQAPEGYAFPGDPRNWEKTKQDTAELSELGRKLLGLDRW